MNDAELIKFFDEKFSDLKSDINTLKDISESTDKCIKLINDDIEAIRESIRLTRDSRGRIIPSEISIYDIPDIR